MLELFFYLTTVRYDATSASRAATFFMLNLSFSICSWNRSGLGDENKCSDVLAELIDLKPSIVLIQETKLSDIPPAKLRSFLPRSLDIHQFKPANGSAGGILSAFSSNLFSLVSSTCHQFSLSTRLSSFSSTKEFVITNVYAPTDQSLIFFSRRAKTNWTGWHTLAHHGRLQPHAFCFWTSILGKRRQIPLMTQSTHFR